MVAFTTAFTKLSDDAQRAVKRAFSEVFNGVTPQTIEVMSGGLSGAQLFKVVVDEQTYVLRLVSDPTSLPDLAYQHLSLAAERGLAPALYWSDPRVGLTLMQYINGRPLAAVLASNPNLITQFAERLRGLHSGPAFSQSVQLFEILRERIGLLPDLRLLPQSTQTALDRLEPICAALEPYLNSAPCHNDLNPANVLVEGERIWFVDWETAGMNDAFFDLATVMHWFGSVPAIEDQLLLTYFQRGLTTWEVAKLELMKYVARCLLGTMFLSIAAQAGIPANTNIQIDPLPRFSEALQAIAGGRLQLHIPADAYRFGLVIINEALLSDQQGLIDAALVQLTLNLNR